MTQTATPQVGVKVKSADKHKSSDRKSRRSSKTRSNSSSSKSIQTADTAKHSDSGTERKLSQKVHRSEADIEKLVDEIICTGEIIAGNIQDAVDDLMGYDTEYAQFLIQRDEEERKRQAEIEKIRRAETPLQRQQRLAREARMSKRRKVQNELYRDDRTPTQKIRDFVKQLSFKKICKKLDKYGLLVQPWQAGTLACLFVLMVATNLSVMGKGTEIQTAPNSYPTYCTNCDHKYDVKRSLFEEYSFYDVHPKDFELQYQKKEPSYPACPQCGVIHQKLILVSRQDRDERFLLATNPYYQMPIDAKGMEDLCNKYQ